MQQDQHTRYSLDVVSTPAMREVFNDDLVLDTTIVGNRLMFVNDATHLDSINFGMCYQCHEQLPNCPKCSKPSGYTATQNCKIDFVEIAGWNFPFLKAKTYMKEHTELNYYYGPGYWNNARNNNLHRVALNDITESLESLFQKLSRTVLLNTMPAIPCRDPDVRSNNESLRQTESKKVCRAQYKTARKSGLAIPTYDLSDKEGICKNYKVLL